MRECAAFPFQEFSVKQKRVLSWWRSDSPCRDHDGVIADGAIRSGKTVSMIDGFIGWSMGFKGQAFILSGKSINALKRNVIMPMRQMLVAKEIPHEYNRSEQCLEFGGNTYYLFGANNEASQDVLQGLTAAGWLGDEVALYPQSFVEQAIGRCSVEGSKYWLNCNPEGPYHYVKTELIDKAEEKRLLHLHFTLDDNPTLSPAIRERYERMFTGVWYKRYILGMWVAAEGAIYDMLDLDVHVVDDLPEMSRYWVGVDYGTATVTTFWLLGLGADGKLYFTDRWRWDVSRTHRQKTDLELGRDLVGWLEESGIVPQHIFVPEDAASFLLQLQQLRMAARHEGRETPLRSLVVADRSPGSVLDGIRDISTLLAFRQLFFSRKLERAGALEEWIGYAWDSKAQDRGEDRPIKQNDHDPDAGRYVVRGIRDVWGRVAR